VKSVSRKAETEYTSRLFFFFLAETEDRNCFVFFWLKRNTKAVSFFDFHLNGFWNPYGRTVDWHVVRERRERGGNHLSVFTPNFIFISYYSLTYVSRYSLSPSSFYFKRKKMESIKYCQGEENAECGKIEFWKSYFL